jgi:hypothetical protein
MVLQGCGQVSRTAPIPQAHRSMWNSYTIPIKDSIVTEQAAVPHSSHKRQCSPQGLSMISVLLGRLLVGIRMAFVYHSKTEHQCLGQGKLSLLQEVARNEMDKSTVNVIQEQMRNIAFHHIVCPAIPEALNMTEYQYLRLFHHADFLWLNIKLCEPHTAFINPIEKSTATTQAADAARIAEHMPTLTQIAIFVVLVDTIFQHAQRRIHFRHIVYLRESPEFTIFQLSSAVYGWKHKEQIQFGCSSLLCALSCFLASNHYMHWLKL